MESKIVWHSLKKEGYPPLFDNGNGYFSSGRILLSGLYFDFFKGKIDRAVSCGGLVKDLRHGMPEFDWVNDNGYCLHHSKIEYWAYMPEPPVEEQI